VCEVVRIQYLLSGNCLVDVHYKDSIILESSKVVFEHLIQDTYFHLLVKLVIIAQYHLPPLLGSSHNFQLLQPFFLFSIILLEFYKL
jgi:hypothetical protein